MLQKITPSIVVFLLAVLMSQDGMAQSKSAFLTAAEEAFVQKDYYSALTYFLNASEFDEKDIDVQYRVAESARLFDAYELAEEKYQTVLDLETDGNYPQATYWLADVKQRLGKFDEAKGIYELYLSEHGDEDPYLTARAEKEIADCERAINKVDNPDQSIKINRLGDQINTDYSEVGAVKHDGKLYYSSLRFDDPNSKNNPDKIISKILSSNDGVVGMTLSEDVNKESLHTAHTAFNRDGSVMYYTICEYVLGADIRCDLYRRPVNADGSYGDEQILPDYVNQAGFTSTQPTVAYNSRTDKEYLYFVSDRIGGKGELDIWYTELSTESGFSTPKNLSEINTAENDITPFFDNGENALYFSSQGYERIGGYDVYKAYTLEGGAFSEPEHLSAPINSSYDDIYFTIDEEGREGYMSSNRNGAYLIDTPSGACCFDIFKLDIEEVNIALNALTFNKNTGDSLSGVTVRVIDMLTGETVGEITNPNSNEHIFDLKKGKDYMIIADKSPFESDTISLSTKEMYTSQDIDKKLFLGIDEVETTISLVDENGDPLDGATVRIIDLSDPDAEDIVYKDVDGGELKVGLDPNKNYRIEVTKDGYEKTTIEIDADKDMDENGKISKTISMKKRDLNIYLPLTLYFDNDRPNPRSTSETTSKTYTSSYNPYIKRKEYYKSRIKASPKNELGMAERQRMDDFFEFDVRGGYDKLNLFMGAVLEKLKEGYTFNISIRGYTSPLARDAYNKALGHRRVASVKNELKKYMEGQLTPYIDNGALSITDVSYGEEQSPQDVSDSPTRIKDSIYSVEASRERRVEIIKISQGGGKNE